MKPSIKVCSGCYQRFNDEALKSHRTEVAGSIVSCLSKSGLEKQGYRLVELKDVKAYWSK